MPRQAISFRFFRDWTLMPQDTDPQTPPTHPEPLVNPEWVRQPENVQLVQLLATFASALQGHQAQGVAGGNGSRAE